MNVFSIKIKFLDTHGALIVVPAIRAIRLTAIPLVEKTGQVFFFFNFSIC